MRRILFVCNNLNHGGIPRALVNLLKSLSGRCSIDLLLFWPHGDYMDELPPDVRLLESPGDLYLLGIPQSVLAQQSGAAAAKRAFYVAISRLIGNSWARRRVFASVPEVTGYDAAVSFAQDNSDKAFAIGCNDFVLSKVRADLKIACVHCDMEHYEGNTPGLLRSYYSFDRIACVSEGCRQAFVRMCPDLEAKTRTAYNCSDYEDIMTRGAAPSGLTKEEGDVVMVTVARLNPEKGFLRAVGALEPVMKSHPQLKWNIVGGGPDEETIRQAVKAAGLEGQIRLLGMQDDPYPYVREADFMLLPSLHEAAPMVYEEARALGTPVLTTATTSAFEMVEARRSGYVCENSAEGIREGVLRLLEEPELLREAAAHMNEEPFDNSRAVEQWLELTGADICS